MTNLTALRTSLSGGSLYYNAADINAAFGSGNISSGTTAARINTGTLVDAPTTTWLATRAIPTPPTSARSSSATDGAPLAGSGPARSTGSATEWAHGVAGS